MRPVKDEGDMNFAQAGYGPRPCPASCRPLPRKTEEAVHAPRKNTHTTAALTFTLLTHHHHSQARLKHLKKTIGAQKLGDVTVDMAIGGMRGITVR